jgi:hypothetical protein
VVSWTEPDGVAHASSRWWRKRREFCADYWRSSRDFWVLTLSDCSFDWRCYSRIIRFFRTGLFCNRQRRFLIIEQRPVRFQQ